MTPEQVRQLIQKEINKATQIKNLIKQEIATDKKKKLYGVDPTSHTHNGIDAPKISYKNLIDIPVASTFASSSSSASINGRSWGAGASIPSGNDTLVELTTNDFVNGITWDGTNDQFVVVTAGQYLITGIATYVSSTAGALYETELSINGDAITPGAFAKSYFQAAANSLAIGPCVTTIANLSVGDKIQLYTWQNSGSTKYLYNSSGLTYLAVASV